MVLLGTAGCLLLAALTYDLHMAISGPLQYKAIMNRELCTKVVARPWMIIIPVQVR